MQKQWLASLLVVIQFGTLLLLAATGWQWPRTPLVWGLGALALLPGLWAIAAMGPGRVSVMPDVQPGARLVTHGPYRWIRHPMYTAVLLGGAALAVNNPEPWRWLVWGILLVNQVVKLRYEETQMMARFPAYEAYRARTKRLIPFVF